LGTRKPYRLYQLQSSRLHLQAQTKSRQNAEHTKCNQANSPQLPSRHHDEVAAVLPHKTDGRSKLLDTRRCDPWHPTKMLHRKQMRTARLYHANACVHCIQRWSRIDHLTHLVVDVDAVCYQQPDNTATTLACCENQRGVTVDLSQHTVHAA